MVFFSGNENFRPVGYSGGLPNAEPERLQWADLPNLLPRPRFEPLWELIPPPVDPNMSDRMNLDEGNVLVNSDYPEVMGASRPPLMVTENGHDAEE
jgi:hypothetical protein